MPPPNPDAGSAKRPGNKKAALEGGFSVPDTSGFRRLNWSLQRYYHPRAEDLAKKLG